MLNKRTAQLSLCIGAVVIRLTFDHGANLIPVENLLEHFTEEMVQLPLVFRKRNLQKSWQQTLLDEVLSGQIPPKRSPSLVLSSEFSGNRVQNVLNGFQDLEGVSDSDSEFQIAPHFERFFCFFSNDKSSKKFLAQSYVCLFVFKRKVFLNGNLLEHDIY